MAVTELSPEEEADRLLGEAINHSTFGNAADAALKHKDAVDLLDRKGNEALFNYLMGARQWRADTAEFRRYCRKARDQLEVGE